MRLFGKIERYSDVDATNASVIESVRSGRRGASGTSRNIPGGGEDRGGGLASEAEAMTAEKRSASHELRDQLRRTRADAEPPPRAAATARAAAASASCRRRRAGGGGGRKDRRRWVR